MAVVSFAHQPGVHLTLRCHLAVVLRTVSWGEDRRYGRLPVIRGRSSAVFGAGLAWSQRYDLLGESHQYRFQAVPAFTAP